MHCRLDSTTLAAGFPQGKQPEFPIGEIPMGQQSCKKTKISKETKMEERSAEKFAETEMYSNLCVLVSSEQSVVLSNLLILINCASHEGDVSIIFSLCHVALWSLLLW